jgi:hypothetical protein
MCILRQLSSVFCIVVFATFASFGRSQGADAARREDPSPPAKATKELAYPLVIRIDRSVLAPLEDGNIDHHGRVDSMYLGTHAVGESRTQGAIYVMMISDRYDASFDVIFKGRTHSSTVGANGPALIYSHTDTTFVCTRPIFFNPRAGFVAVASTVVADTQLVNDDFGSSRGCLGRWVISHVAKRRAGKSHEEYRQNAASDTEHKLQAGFDKRLDTRLTTMNQSMNVARYVTLFMGEAFAMQISARMSKDCIYVGVGHEGRPVRLTSVPPRCAAAAPIEIGVHSTLFGGHVAKLLGLFGDKTVPQPPSRQELLRALAISDKESARIVDVGVQDGWFVLGLQNGTPASSPTATTPQTTP